MLPTFIIIMSSSNLFLDAYNTSSSISTRNLPSFQGLQLSTVKVSPSVKHLEVGSGLYQRALRGLIASKVVFSSPIFVSPNLSVFFIEVCCIVVCGDFYCCELCWYVAGLGTLEWVSL